MLSNFQTRVVTPLHQTAICHQALALGSAWRRVGRSRFAALLGVVACVALSACTSLTAYRTAVPKPEDVSECLAGAAPNSTPNAAPCVAQATERNALYTLHLVEFDDEGVPFSTAERQIDSAISQIKRQLGNPDNCVRLFVYVHGWRHNAQTKDSNVENFREFLRQVSERSKASAGTGQNACEDPEIARAAKSTSAEAQAPKKGRVVHTVGIYVGWRGLSVVDVQPLVYTSFWDRKNTADRVSQGSVRELFGRLSALATYAPAAGKPGADRPASQGQLRTYVIGHSFGAAIVFRALSQSLIDSFAGDLDGDVGAELSTISRFVDMVVLVNPAIEAARFDPVFRAADKRKAHCESNQSSPSLCAQPKYQAPVLAIFQSEGDQATKHAFTLGAGLSNTFESTLGEAEHRSITQTIGWDDDYSTHKLAVSAQCDQGTNGNPYESAANGSLRYRPPGWTWCFDDFSLAQLGASVQGTEGRTVYNGPLWNVRVATEIVKDHGDIWNPRFRGVLLRLFTDEQIHPLMLNISSLTPAIVPAR